MLELSASRYAAVVFDMDGVITDTARTHAAAWKRMFDEFLRQQAAVTGGAVRPFGDDDYLEYVDGRPRDAGVEAFLATRGICLPHGSPDDSVDTASVWGLANRKNREFLHVVAAEGVRVFASSVALVAALQERSIGTAIISASRNCQRILEAAGIGDLFPVRVDGIELEHLGLRGKPDPAMFLEAARRLGASAETTVVVEDAVAGVEAGRNGNFGLVIGIDRHGDRHRLLAHGADVVVADLGEIALVP